MAKIDETLEKARKLKKQGVPFKKMPFLIKWHIRLWKGWHFNPITNWREKRGMAKNGQKNL